MSETAFARILVVDDEAAIRRFLRSSLGGVYSILEADTGMDALKMAAVYRPDLVLLDLGLPDIDGYEVIERLREWTVLPIIVLSVRDQEEDKVKALDSGADDYLSKPFSVVELMARVRSTLRHCAKFENDFIYRNGDLTVNLAERLVTLEDRPVVLTHTEYDVLRSLVNQAGKVLTHKQLIRAVWGDELEVDSHLLRVNVSNLRKKIELDPSRPRYIVTEPGVGYRLREASVSSPVSGI